MFWVLDLGLGLLGLELSAKFRVSKVRKAWAKKKIVHMNKQALKMYPTLRTSFNLVGNPHLQVWHIKLKWDSIALMVKRHLDVCLKKIDSYVQTCRAQSWPRPLPILCKPATKPKVRFSAWAYCSGFSSIASPVWTCLILQ